jgi:hypothetical protein
MFRFDVINLILEKYELNSYLELGIFHGETISKINAEIKHGVGPGNEGFLSSYVTHKCTSDAFFSNLNSEVKYDAIFIDGLHHANQVLKDIVNSFKHLSSNGYLILHDCIPASYEAQLVPRQTAEWTGDVWRAFLGFRKANQHFLSYTVDTDWGIGVIKNTGQHSLNEFNISDISYDDFVNDKQNLLNIISIEDFKNIL